MSEKIRCSFLTRAQIDAYRAQCMETLAHAIRDMAPPASRTVANIVDSIRACDALMGSDEAAARAEMELARTEFVLTGTVPEPLPETIELGTIAAGEVLTDDKLSGLLADALKAPSKKGKGK